MQRCRADCRPLRPHRRLLRQQRRPRPRPPAPRPRFPSPIPQNFTAASPTKETINAFLAGQLGIRRQPHLAGAGHLQDAGRRRQQGGLLVGDKTGKEKPSALQFFALPDGKHIITGDQIVAFGEHPFADFRAQLQQQANGPYRGSA